MTDEEKKMAKRNLITIDEFLQVLRRSVEVVEKIKKRAVETNCHKRAITAKATLTGMFDLIDDLEHGRLLCMEFLGAKKVPIVIERKLKLVVNNTGGVK
jgi:hypothetical protein